MRVVAVVVLTSFRVNEMSSKMEEAGVGREGVIGVTHLRCVAYVRAVATTVSHVLD